ncbi:MAG: C-GCAxxG-C-C family (seleno)protein [Oscillospiraceae bacterium]
MLRDLVAHYYLEGNDNCAEALLRAADEAYGFALDEASYKLIGGFGGGMGCGRVCGALAGCIAALGVQRITGRAHETPDFGAACAACVADFSAALGGTECSELKPRYVCPETRCLETVLRAADVLEQTLAAQPMKKEKTQ